MCGVCAACLLFPVCFRCFGVCASSASRPVPVVCLHVRHDSCTLCDVDATRRADGSSSWPIRLVSVRLCASRGSRSVGGSAPQSLTRWGQAQAEAGRAGRVARTYRPSICLSRGGFVKKHVIWYEYDASQKIIRRARPPRPLAGPAPAPAVACAQSRAGGYKRETGAPLKFSPADAFAV